MTDPNENKRGYKKTKVGWIPKDWETKLLGEIVRAGRPIVYGIVQAGPDIPGGIPYIRSTDVGEPFVSAEHLLRTTPEIAQEYRRAAVEPGDVVFSLRGEIGAVSCVPEELDGANLTQGTARISPNKMTDSQFVRHVLESYEVRRLVNAWAKGSTFREVTIDDLRKVPIPYPTFEEQRRIAQPITTLEWVIKGYRDLTTAKKEQKKALMQQLLTGKKRMPGFRDKWVQHKIRDLFKEVTRPVDWDDNDEYNLLSVRRRSGGVFLREKLMGSQIATKVMFIAHAGDFLISKMQVLHGATGLVSSELDGSHISGSYIALRPSGNKLVDPEFFARLSEMHEFRHLTYLCSYGVHIEKMTFNLEWFLDSKITLPPSLREQHAIVNVLKSADDEIRALETKLTALKEQKKGLMQKLLTGQIRVKI